MEMWVLMGEIGTSNAVGVAIPVIVLGVPCGDFEEDGLGVKRDFVRLV